MDPFSTSRHVLVLAGLACACSPAQRANERPVERRAATDAATGDVADAPDAGAALDGYPKVFELRDGKEKLGVVAVPLGAREPRPIVIALHGGSEKPEEACPAWREVTSGWAFVVCPRGWGGDEARLGWRGAVDTSARIARAVAATKATFAPWVKETRSWVLAGFSMGGSEVARVARHDPRAYPRLVIGDCAHDPQPALTFSREWVKAGGQRAAFLCTTSGCEPSMRAAARSVARETARARLNIAPTQKHGLSDRAARSMRRDWAWLVDGAEGWEMFSAPVPHAEADPREVGRTESFGPD